MDYQRFDKRGYPTLPVKSGYAEWAPTYDATVAEQLDARLLGNIDAIPWTSVDRALDLGCGTGRTGRWMHEHGVKHIDGIDFTPEMLVRARALGVYDTLTSSDVRETNLPAASYDVVTSVLVDEHLPVLQPLYAEASRVLKPNGNFILVGYHPYFLLNGIPTHFDRASGEPIAIEVYVHLLADHFEAAKDAGLQVLDLREQVIDDVWIATKANWAKYAGWPASFMIVTRADTRPRPR